MAAGQDTNGVNGVQSRVDHILQALLLQESLVLAEEEESVANVEADMSGQVTPSPVSTLREQRRSGPLSEFSEEAYTTFLNGSLYEYNDGYNDGDSIHTSLSLPSARGQQANSNVDILSLLQEVTSSRPSTATSVAPPVVNIIPPEIADEPSRSLASTVGTEGFWRDLGSGEGPAVSSGAPPPGSRGDDEEVEILGGDGTQTFNLHGLLRRLVAEESRVVTPVADSQEWEVSSPDVTRGSGRFWETSRTIMGDTGAVAVEGGDGPLTFNLHGILRRLLAEGEFDAGMARTAHRLLQHSSVANGQRLTSEEIEALPKVRFEATEAQTCAICLEVYRKGELLTELRCNHFFHTDCLAGWFRRSTQCPLCRALQRVDEEHAE